jgi:hypothetical protein
MPAITPKIVILKKGDMLKWRPHKEPPFPLPEPEDFHRKSSLRALTPPMESTRYPQKQGDDASLEG